MLKIRRRSRRLVFPRKIVVTQSFHVGRAVALCRHLGVDATGVGDESVKPMRAIWTRNLIRERGAVVKAVYDVVSGRDPALLGRQETGIQDALQAS